MRKALNNRRKLTVFMQGFYESCTPARTHLICFIIILILIFPLSVFSWDGMDYDTGNYIEIDDSDIPSIAPGAIIQIYDNEDSDYHTVEIMSVVKAIDETNIEVFDQDTEEYRTFEMEPVVINRGT